MASSGISTVPCLIVSSTRGVTRSGSSQTGIWQTGGSQTFFFDFFLLFFFFFTGIAVVQTMNTRVGGVQTASYQPMFYFQYVVQRVRIDYDEFSPEVSIRFGDITNKLELPDLQVGDNMLGLGKELVIHIEEAELREWFQEYAFCVQFRGGLLNGRHLGAVCSLQRLDLTDEIANFPILLKDKWNAKVRVELEVSLKFRHVHSVERGVARIPSAQYAQPREQKAEEQKTSKVASGNVKKPASFLYGNTSKALVKTHSTSSRAKSAQKRDKPNQPKSNILNQEQPRFPQIEFEAYQGPRDNCTFQDVSADDMFRQNYYCPPAMQFTNTPAEPPQPLYEVMLPPPLREEIENYSFQGDSGIKEKPPLRDKKEKIIHKAKVEEAINKRRIKELVEQEFRNTPSSVMVPVRSKKGDIIFKKLEDIEESDLSNLISNPKVSPQQQSNPSTNPKHKNFVPTSLPVRVDTSPRMNISMQYPEDFESISLTNQSILNRELSSISKIRKAEEVVLEESIASEIYSDNFESYSASRSNLRRSNDDISESLRSLSQSYRK